MRIIRKLLLDEWDDEWPSVLVISILLILGGAVNFIYKCFVVPYLNIRDRWTDWRYPYVVKFTAPDREVMFAVADWVCDNLGPRRGQFVFLINQTDTPAGTIINHATVYFRRKDVSVQFRLTFAEYVCG